MMQARQVSTFLLGILLPFYFLPAVAQGPELRIRQPINEAARVVLPGSRTPQARTEQDIGPVSPEMRVPGITLAFRRSPAQEAALSALLTSQQNPASALYHRWMTPETFAARFGMADSDIVTTENWLMSQGFRVESVARSRDRITFSGTALQVHNAFGSELHHYLINGEVHFAPESDLTLPAELASVSGAILHLSDFRPKPNWKALASVEPDYTSAATQAHYLSPKDIFTMYDLGSFNDRYLYGSGQGLAVVGQSFVNTSDTSPLSVFQTFLSQYNFINPVLVPNSGVEAISPGDEGESEIDLEYSSGIAQNANIFLVYVGSNQNYSVFDALAFAITENVAPVVSISYGACEPLLSASELTQYNALFEEASAQGQTLVASSGDSGSTACAPYTSAQGATPAERQELAVNFPASSPYVTAVGGTQMSAGTFTAGSSPYWAAPGPGSTDTVSSLLSYVPEVVWNEGSAANGILAAGGGTSIYFPRPAWQSDFAGMPGGAYRLVPDIALQASVASPGFLLCSSDLALIGSEGQTASCTNGLLGSNNKYTLAGGTSFAAPIFAGYLALLNQLEGATGQGNINPELYSLAANPNSYASAFHDITSGTNACAAGAALCAASGESSYTATGGYDEATGLGSLDFTALAAAWPASDTPPLQPTSILITGSGTAATPGQTVPIQIYVDSTFSAAAPSSPTGTVSVSLDGTVLNSSLAISPTGAYSSQGSVSYSVVAPTTSGSHLIAVTYSGDATHSPSTVTYPVLVGNVLASGGISLSAGNLTVANGGSGTTEVTVTPSGGYNGRLVWSLTATSSSNATLTACYAIASLPVDGTSMAKLTIGIGTACNSPLPAAHGEARPLTHHPVTSGTPPSGLRGPSALAIYGSLVFCGCVTGRRRKMRSFLLFAIVFFPIAGADLIGCGGGATSTGTSTTTPSTTNSYSLTLTATDSVNASVEGATTFTLMVK